MGRAAPSCSRRGARRRTEPGQDYRPKNAFPRRSVAKFASGQLRGSNNSARFRRSPRARAGLAHHLPESGDSDSVTRLKKNETNKRRRWPCYV
jgi:hypothetical protein